MDITVQELKSKMERGDRFVLIDVREPDEHQAFNVGGHLIPLGTVPHTIPELEEHQEEEVIIYCRSGRRSATAQYMLLQAGFKNVRNLEGGMLAWIELFGEK
ncbi:MAG: rhodanese-like domain-containing protein [Haliscomenobacter sp.]|nr:rhodanese-like domain-containing protein [Haliscomenobacter sp.]